MCGEVALKIMTFSLMVKRFPKLLVCQLTFSQLIKHDNSLAKHLAMDADVSDQLSHSLDITAARKWIIRIEPSEVLVPNIAFKHDDPDAHYYDALCA